MTAETKSPFARDAALSVGWTEATKRALSDEAFLKSYPTSNRATQVKSLYNLYLGVSMYGLNNTPMFDYDTKRLIRRKSSPAGSRSKGTLPRALPEKDQRIPGSTREKSRYVDAGG
ncbi:hypothetical protein VQ056_27755 [Paenibacillus sp. JTLBN-2024]